MPSAGPISGLFGLSEPCTSPVALESLGSALPHHALTPLPWWAPLQQPHELETQSPARTPEEPARWGNGDRNDCKSAIALLLITKWQRPWGYVPHSLERKVHPLLLSKKMRVVVKGAEEEHPPSL